MYREPQLSRSNLLKYCLVNTTITSNSCSIAFCRSPLCRLIVYLVFLPVLLLSFLHPSLSSFASFARSCWRLAPLRGLSSPFWLIPTLFICYLVLLSDSSLLSTLTGMSVTSSSLLISLVLSQCATIASSVHYNIEYP
jgi:hypothetical protein